MLITLRGVSAERAGEPKGGQHVMILDPEEWMDLRRFRALHDAGVSISAIARETGHHWRTVKKYSRSPLGRLRAQHELDAAVIFLASPAPGYITGSTPAVDDGMSGH